MRFENWAGRKNQWLFLYCQFTVHTSQLTIHFSQFTFHSSPFTLHHSQFTVHSSLPANIMNKELFFRNIPPTPFRKGSRAGAVYCQFTIHRSPFTVHHSHFAVHRSQFTIHNSLFTIYHSPLYALLVVDGLDGLAELFDVELLVLEVFGVGEVFFVGLVVVLVVGCCADEEVVRHSTFHFLEGHCAILPLLAFLLGEVFLVFGVHGLGDAVGACDLGVAGEDLVVVAGESGEVDPARDGGL